MKNIRRLNNVKISIGETVNFHIFCSNCFMIVKVNDTFWKKALRKIETVKELDLNL